MEYSVKMQSEFEVNIKTSKLILLVWAEIWLPGIHDYLQICPVLSLRFSYQLTTLTAVTLLTILNDILQSSFQLTISLNLPHKSLFQVSQNLCSIKNKIYNKVETNTVVRYLSETIHECGLGLMTFGTVHLACSHVTVTKNLRDPINISVGCLQPHCSYIACWNGESNVCRTVKKKEKKCMFRIQVPLC